MSSWFWDGVDVEFVTLNAQPSAVLRKEGAVLAVLAIGVSADGIDRVFWVMNPAKLSQIPGRSCPS